MDGHRSEVRKSHTFSRTLPLSHRHPPIGRLTSAQSRPIAGTPQRALGVPQGAAAFPGREETRGRAAPLP